MGDFVNDCKSDCCNPCNPRPECCCRPPASCENDNGNIWGILILLLVLYFLFCGNDQKGGGLFGGLF